MLALQIDRLEAVAALPAAACLLMYVLSKWRHRRCIGAILVALPAAACLCQSNSIIIAP